MGKDIQFRVNGIEPDDLEMPYTKEELDARIAEAERQYANHQYLPADEAMRRVRERLLTKDVYQYEAV